MNELRNAERKRLRERARQLTDEDLLSVMLMRKEKGSDGHLEDAESNTGAGAPMHNPSA